MDLCCQIWRFYYSVLVFFSCLLKTIQFKFIVTTSLFSRDLLPKMLTRTKQIVTLLILERGMQWQFQREDLQLFSLRQRNHKCGLCIFIFRSCQLPWLSLLELILRFLCTCCSYMAKLHGKEQGSYFCARLTR